MNEIVIKVEDLGKQYRLGQVGTGTISHDINRWWHKVRGKEDPYLKVGETNDRSTKGESDLVWVLKNINFEVKRGEVLGIIGKNGAGKSTLLKILSQVTGPTLGNIKVKGRIASLLEVGTGFHPELTGRENIFLNGAILGMSKTEIKRKFDEIIAFSGVERYIDTPVKRYSSGMYVRLAFAVAAHLEPEILIIDEVLAVGDAEFQKKCLGKMKDVAGEGRTVLFVSHNMSAVSNLCNRTIMLQQGSLTMNGPTMEVVERYLEASVPENTEGSKDPFIVPDDLERPWGNRSAKFKRIELLNSKNEQTTDLFFDEPFTLRIIFHNDVVIKESIFQIRISTADGQQITYSNSNSDTNKTFDFDIGPHEIKVHLDPKLMPGKYSFYIFLSSPDGVVFHDAIANFLRFTVKNTSLGDHHYLSSKVNTFIHLPSKWDLIN